LTANLEKPSKVHILDPMKKLAFLALAIALTGCTQMREDYETELGQWVGRAERDLFLHFGPPSKVFEVDKTTRIAQFKTERDAIVPGTPFPSSYIGQDGKRHTLWLDTPDRVIKKRCDLQFVLNGRKQRATVSDWKYSGNDCFRLR